MIIYASRTGNVRSIVNRLLEIDPTIQCSDMKVSAGVSEPFLLITYTDKLGQAPEEVINFMKHHHHLCRGVVASGNTNFGKVNFAKAADLISEMFNVDSLHKIDLRGKDSDWQIVAKMYRERFITS